MRRAPIAAGLLLAAALCTPAAAAPDSAVPLPAGRLQVVKEIRAGDGAMMMFLSLDDIVAQGDDRVAIVLAVSDPPTKGVQQIAGRVRIGCLTKTAEALGAGFYGPDGRLSSTTEPQTPETMDGEGHPMWPFFEALCTPGKTPAGTVVTGDAAALALVRNGARKN